MKKLIILSILITKLGTSTSIAQYDPKYVEVKNVVIKGETYAVDKLMCKDDRIKVKYFAFKAGKVSVYQRYKAWAANKSIVATCSGTYMTTCEAATAKPVGLCVDNGNKVNEDLRNDMDGLLIVYATGGMTAVNLKEGVNININGKDTLLDPRNNSYERIELLDWAQSEEVTLFQTHLLAYKNQLKITNKMPASTASRRFLASCKAGKNIVNYIINMKAASTLYDAAVKAFNYLKELEDVEVTFMINLDTGCQDVFKTFDKAGNEIVAPNFSGTYDIPKAVNLLVYYYE